VDADDLESLFQHSAIANDSMANTTYKYYIYHSWSLLE